MEISIQEIITQLRQKLQPNSETPLLDAQVLVAHIMEKPRTWVLAHPDSSLDAAHYQRLIQCQQRLENGEPLPYVLGHWEFYGLDFLVSPHVLIPRPETELVVERAINWLQRHPHKRKALDVGTGSGCIAIAIAKHIPDLQILMMDISPEALDVARANAKRHGLLDQVEFLQSDLLEQLSESSTYDLICANLPYIPTEIVNTLPVAKKEPDLALDGGVAGLQILTRLLPQAADHISPGGLLLLEIDPNQRQQMEQQIQDSFPSARVLVWQDLSGKDRCFEIDVPYLVYHLCSRQEWVNSLALGQYQATSLVSEGFIHCSLADQYIDVANRYFKNVPGIVKLTINPAQLSAEIRWERSGNAYYPHIYGAINLDAVLTVEDLIPDDEGIYR